MKYECSCMGMNEHCSRCYGTGVYDDRIERMPPVRYAGATRSPDSLLAAPTTESAPPAVSAADTLSVELALSANAAASLTRAPPSDQSPPPVPLHSNVQPPPSTSSPSSRGAVSLTDPTADPDTLEECVGHLLRIGLTRPVGQSRPRRLAGESRTVYERRPDVKAWVLQEARGHCELCVTNAPFVRSDGTPYLEHHHVQRLCEGGPDTVENSVALCANCHRRLHHGADREEQKSLLYALVARLIRCDGGSAIQTLTADDTSAAQPAAGGTEGMSSRPLGSES